MSVVVVALLVLVAALFAGSRRQKPAPWPTHPLDDVEVCWPESSNTERLSSPDGVLAFVAQTQANDWHSGSGTLSLWRDGCSLIVSKNKDRGYMVSFLAAGASTPGEVVVKSTDFSEVSWVLTAGEKWAVPAAFLVDPETVGQAVAHFFVAGEKLKTLRWVDAASAMSTAGL